MLFVCDVTPCLLTPPENASFDDFSAYDVADMVKLYFRELPEPLLTSKLSETLIVIQESEWTLSHVGHMTPPRPCHMLVT